MCNFISRPIISLTLLLVLLHTSLPNADAQTFQARIKLDIDRTIGEADPHLFGNFAEHLRRMIYGGIYDEGSPLSDKDGYRKDVMEAVRRDYEFFYTFPAHSQTILRLRLKNS